MTKTSALIGSMAFFFIAPGTIAGLIPWLVTHWHIQGGASLTLSVIGGVLIAISLAILIECFARFALKGVGTPAPVAPTQHLVVSGLYRYVRNPMYVAVLGLILGQLLLFGQAALLAYAVTVWLVVHVFVVSYEEPTLRASFPDEYEAYFENVPRWLPRLTPWRQEASPAP